MTPRQDTGPVACSRMYNVAPAARAAWDAMFDWLSETTGHRLNIIGYEAPAPLDGLWARPDLGAAFMCGYPYQQRPRDARPIVLAAPVSTETWSEGGPYYASQIVMRDSAEDGADLAKARWAWTVRDSQSGYNAPREFLAARDSLARVATVGPLVTPFAVVEALRSGRADAGGVDAYAWQLLKLHAPDQIAGLKTVATTARAPFPMLVAAQALDRAVAADLAKALLRSHQLPEAAALLADLGLARFAEPDFDAVEALAKRAEQTDLQLGGPW